MVSFLVPDTWLHVMGSSVRTFSSPRLTPGAAPQTPLWQLLQYLTRVLSPSTASPHCFCLFHHGGGLSLPADSALLRLICFLCKLTTTPLLPIPLSQAGHTLTPRFTVTAFSLTCPHRSLNSKYLNLSSQASCSTCTYSPSWKLSKFGGFSSHHKSQI